MVESVWRNGKGRKNRLPRAAESKDETAHRSGQRDVIVQLYRIGKRSIGTYESDREVRFKVEPVGLLVAQQIRWISALPRHAKIDSSGGANIGTDTGAGPIALKKRVCAWSVPGNEGRELVDRIVVRHMTMHYKHIARRVGRPVTIKSRRTGKVVKACC